MNSPPPSYNTAGILLLVAGCMGAMWHGMWAFGLLFSIFSGVICGPVCCFFPLAMVPVALSEAWMGYRILQGEPVPAARNVAMFGIVGSALTCAFTVTACEVAAFAILSRPEMVAWLAGEGTAPVGETA